MENASSTVTETVSSVLLTNERGRRLFHVSGSAVPALYLAGLATWTQIRICYAVGLTVGIVLEMLRLYGGLEWTLFDRLTREYEQDALAGYLLYVLSSATVAILFEPGIAIPSILMLTLGDPISGLVGSGEFRRVKRPPALATMFLVCTLISLPFVPDAPLAAVLAAGVATIADGVKPVVSGYVIDDNLTIPPLAAVALLAGLELGATLG
jgi:dolichol kinase